MSEDHEMVTIRFFAMLRNLAGRDQIELEIKGESKYKDFVSDLRGRFPQVVDMIDKKRVLVSVNQDLADDNTIIKDGDEVAIMPPFSGGSEPGDLIRIQKEDFSLDEEIAKVKKTSSRIGGIATFLGTARDFSKGREIKSLAFQYYEGMAQKRLSQIRDKALKDFNIIEVGIVHRYGDIKIADNIVLIVVAAEHRDEAFTACKWCIDELKRITPIWKMETTPQGDIWVEEHP
ncbi:MAG: MoaD family protein [Nitrospirota bacterium]